MENTIQKRVTSHCTEVNAQKIWNSSGERSQNRRLAYLQHVLCPNNNRITALKKAGPTIRCHTTNLQAAESTQYKRILDIPNSYK